MKRIFIISLLFVGALPIIAKERDSINLRLKYNDPIGLTKNVLCSKEVITIESDLETDEYFGLTIFKKALGKVYLRGVSEHRIVYGWLELKKEQLYVMLKETETAHIRLYSKPCADDKYLMKEGEGEHDLYPVVDVNLKTGWVAIRYDDGKCYWVSPEVQCPWYTECHGS
ncbi:MAG: hypothetical protein J5621_03910 [Paludibacteraceae bacterium]|nr:hypothetical protein [Paludibacteraceae bacterium]